MDYLPRIDHKVKLKSYLLTYPKINTPRDSEKKLLTKKVVSKPLTSRIPMALGLLSYYAKILKSIHTAKAYLP